MIARVMTDAYRIRNDNAHSHDSSNDGKHHESNDLES